MHRRHQRRGYIFRGGLDESLYLIMIIAGMSSGLKAFLLDRSLTTTSNSFSVNAEVEMLSCSATWVFGRSGVTVGASPRSFLKWLSQPSLRFSADPPLTTVDGLYFLPVIYFMVFQAAECCLNACSEEMLLIFSCRISTVSVS